MGKLRTLNLYCVDTSGGGGTEVWARSLIKSLACHYEVRLISRTLDPELDKFVSKFIRVRLPSKPAFIKVILYSIFSSFVPKSNADVMHAIGAITFRKSNLNTIHFYHRENLRLRDRTIYENKSKIRVVNRVIYTLICILLEKIIYTQLFSSKLASVSPEMCNLLKKDFGREVHLTHNGIDPSELGSNNALATHPYLLFVGGDWERKGLADVIKSVAIIRFKFPSIRLYIVGSGSKEQYELIVRDLKIEQNIVWMGRMPRSEIPYHSQSILVSASNFEVSPLIFLEAAMSGAPVISYPTFGTLEAKEDGYLRTCEPTPEGISEEIIELLSDKSKMSIMSRAGIRLRVTKNWERVVMETLALYPGSK